MRTTLAILSLFFLAASTLLFDPAHLEAASDSLHKVQQERQAIKAQLSKNEREIAQVLDEMNALHKEMTEIEQQLQENNTKLQETETKIVEYEKQFYELLEEINKLNETIDKRHEILKNRLSAYQETGGDISFLEVIFNAKSFTEFLSRVTSVTAITTADRELIQQQTEDRKNLEQHQNLIVEKLEKQEELKKEYEATKAKIEQQKDVLKAKENELKKREEQLNKEKEKLANEDNKLQVLEQSYRNEMKVREQKQITKAAATVKTTAKSDKNKKTDKAKDPIEVGETYRMIATAYTPFCNGCSGVTSTGINVKSQKHQRIIAVDPSVIPLGSKVWVEGYGVAIAADTGTAIKGNRIDVLFKSDSQARNWGVRTVTVKVLK